MAEMPGAPRPRCRYYEEQFPAIDSCVVVEVLSIAEMGAYVKLLEYDGVEGMILLSELSRRRIRSINKLIRVGKREVAMVMRVDTEKGYIDLSKRRVAAADAVKCEERFSKGKAVNSIMSHVAETANADLLELNEKITWPLEKKFGSAYEALRLALVDQDSVFSQLPDPKFLTNEIVQPLMVSVKRKLTPQPIKIRGDIELTCFTYEGIDAIREALVEAPKVKPDLEVSIKLVAPPHYVLITTSTDKNQGINDLNAIIDKAKEVLESKGGSLVVKEAPRATTTQEENRLQDLFTRMERENAEIDGDEAEED